MKKYHDFKLYSYRGIVTTYIFVFSIIFYLLGIFFVHRNDWTLPQLLLFAILGAIVVFGINYFVDLFDRRIPLHQGRVNLVHFPHRIIKADKIKYRNNVAMLPRIFFDVISFENDTLHEANSTASTTLDSDHFTYRLEVEVVLSYEFCTSSEIYILNEYDVDTHLSSALFARLNSYLEGFSSPECETQLIDENEDDFIKAFKKFYENTDFIKKEIEDELNIGIKNSCEFINPTSAVFDIKILQLISWPKT